MRLFPADAVRAGAKNSFKCLRRVNWRFKRPKFAAIVFENVRVRHLATIHVHALCDARIPPPRLPVLPALLLHGLDMVKKFKSVLHAAQSLECNRRKRELEARIAAQSQGRKTANRPSKKFGIIRTGNKRTSVMKKAKNAMLALTLGLTGAAGLFARRRKD